MSVFAMVLQLKASGEVITGDYIIESSEAVSLPALSFDGDALLGRIGTNAVMAATRPSIAAIEKSGDGTLSLGNAFLVNGECNLRGGTLKLSKRFYAHAGLMEATYIDMEKGLDVKGQTLWGSGTGDKIEEKISDEDWTYSRDGAKKIFDGYTCVISNDITRATAVLYKGYIWNDAATNETWQFAMHLTYRINMKLNGRWTPFGNSGEGAKTNVWTATVKPGANPFIVYSLSANWNKTQSVSPRFDGLGLSYDRNPVSGTTNAAHFVRLDDNGCGRLLTFDGSAPQELDASQRTAISRLICAKGTSIDLNGNDLEAGKLIGTPRIHNSQCQLLDGSEGLAAVQITESWDPTDVSNGPLQADCILRFADGARITTPTNTPNRGARIIAWVRGIEGVPKTDDANWRLHCVTSSNGGTYLVLSGANVKPTLYDCVHAVNRGRFTPTISDNAFPNPLKGFRPDLFDAKNGTQGDYGRLMRFYIPWGEIEEDESDGIEKIRAYCDQNFSCLPDSTYKVIPRIRIKNGSGKNGNVPTYSYPADMADKVDWEGTVWDGDVFTNRMIRLIERLGECWDNDPRIAWIQMGIYGAWGEHHTPRPSTEMQKIMADTFNRVFKHKKVLVRSADDFVDYEFGYYWDSWAHIQQWSSTGQGAGNMRKRINEGRYLTQPIEGETAYDWGNYAIQPGDSPDDTLSDPTHTDFLEMTIRSMHCSGLGWVARYHPTNDLIKAGAARIQKAFGYRYELGDVTFDRISSPGGTLSVTGSVVNVGSAPFYYEWPLTAALLDPQTRKPMWQEDFGTDIRTWVPGDCWDETNSVYTVAAPICAFGKDFKLPANIVQGQYILALAIRDPGNGEPSVRFAIEPVAKDLWHDLGLINLINGDLGRATKIVIR